MFEWKSGDEDEWVDEATAVPERTSTHFTGKVRALLAGVVFCLLLLVALGLAYRSVETRVTAVTSTFEQEILAADRLLVETAVRDDAELFAALLRPSPTWTEVQTRLQARDTFFNRPPLGLWLDTRTDLFAAEFLSTTHFAISPDLNRAELISTMPYITLDEAGEVQSLLLQRTAVYQRQGNSSA
ncbi:MAG: hypothetical protein HC804_10490, partial [Anaerolineae bacterium]|nr:hypothetical protein [Anaerolineae bacterium]